jgi:alkyl hydroperoxide reductase subunit AhpC
LQTQELEAELKTLLKDKQLLTSEAEELKNKLQVFRKHAVDFTPNITTEWLNSLLEFSVLGCNNVV